MVDMRLGGAVAVALVLGLLLGYVYASGATRVSTTTLLSTYVEKTTVTVTSTKRLVETSTVERTSVSVSTTVSTRTVRVMLPVELIDALGRRMRLNATPSRIVSLSPAITETIYALGAFGKLVGVDSVSDYPPLVVELRRNGSIADVGGYWWSYVNVERIVELKPDLVIAEVGAHAPLRSVFEEKGLRVLYVRGGAAKSIADVKQDILLIGSALGCGERAEEIVSLIDSTIRDISDRLRASNASWTRVYVEVGEWQGQLWTAGGDTFINDLVSRAGGLNVFARYTGYPQISYEDVVAANPTVIVVPAKHIGSREDAAKALRRIAGRPGWGAISAVQEGRVYVLMGEAGDALLRPGPRVVEALRIMASILHPDVFGVYGGGDVVHLLAAPHAAASKLVMTV